MKDRIPANPGRVLITPEDGSAAYYATMTRADNPTQVGDPLNKNTFLKDTTAAMFGLNQDAVPDDMFRLLSPIVPGNQGVENAGKYWKVDENGGLVFENPTAKFSNGPFVITATQTVDFTKYGLKPGDQINVVCIGGGAGASTGGAAGKGGTGRGGGGGGGGGGYGGGGGGQGGEYRGGNGYRGGGSGYISSATVTLSSTSVAATVGAGGAKGANGGTTSCGGYLSAAGGNANGSGGHAGGLGGEGLYSTQYEEGGGGGGGGGGWLVEGPTVYSGSGGEPGINATSKGGGAGGAGGTGGGSGGSEGANGNDGGPGHGAVIFWY